MRSFRKQFRTLTPVLLIAYLVTFLSLLSVIITSTYKSVPLDIFTKDPTAIMNAPFYIGAFSNIGIMLWSGAAVLCFFTAFSISRQRHLKEEFKFLIVSALITLMLAVDDMFLVHEEVFPYYFNLNANAVIITYINIFIIYIILFRARILQSEFIALGLAFFCLGLSTVIDLLPLPIEKDTFLEDAIKLFGVVSWFIYFYRYSRQVLFAVRPL